MGLASTEFGDLRLETHKGASSEARGLDLEPEEKTMARRRRKTRRKRRSSGLGGSRKECVVKSGPKKGKLKKGWRYGKNGRCVRAKRK